MTKDELRSLIDEVLQEVVSELPIKHINEEELDERKKKGKKKKKKKLDRCARIAKRKYKVWPSAYASGAAVKCRKGKIWKGLKEEEELEERKKKEGLRKWFGRKGAPGKEKGWVDCNAPKYKKGKKVGYKSCGRKEGEKRSKYPACRPTAAHSVSQKEKARNGERKPKARRTNEQMNLSMKLNI